MNMPHEITDVSRHREDSGETDSAGHSSSAQNCFLRPHSSQAPLNTRGDREKFPRKLGMQVHAAFVAFLQAANES